jgi:hypothetical protein
MKAVWLLAVGLAICVSFPEQPSAKPVQESKFHLDLPEPPLTLDDLWSRADVVIEGTIARIIPADVDSPDSDPPRSLLFTDYEIAIAEVFKSDSRTSRKSATLQIKRQGGTRDRGDHIYRRIQDGFAEFKQGERYIFFLDDLTRGYYAVDSPDRAFLITSGGIKPRGESVLAETLSALPASAIRDLLRQRGGARSPAAICKRKAAPVIAWPPRTTASG